MKLTLSSQVVLARDLLPHQARALQIHIMSSLELNNNPHFDVKEVHLGESESKFPGDYKNWYVYFENEALAEAIKASPETFTFEV
jgi:hypothetical protein